jgi:tetratricopeptide (TPR) repeat protein
MKDYVEDWTVSKIGNAFNHVYRRADVTKEVPDDVKLKRLYRAIERNPRIISLVILLEREARMMKALPPADEERIRAIILRTIERFPDDSTTRQLVNSSLYSKDSKLVQKALAISLEHDPDSISGYFILADAYEKEGNLVKAEEAVMKAIPLATGDDNSVLYRLIWLNEQLDRPDKVREYARQAIKRRPKDDRPWSDLASSLERLANRAGRTPEEALSLRAARPSSTTGRWPRSGARSRTTSATSSSGWSARSRR